MNTPPTMSAAPLPMAPVKSNRKQVIKPDVKPKKLLYNDQDFEMPSKQEKSIICSVETLETQEKVQSPVKSKIKKLPDLKYVAKHVEQNELDTESEQVEDKEIKVDHPYNLRRRNKTPAGQVTQQVTRKKIVKSKFEDEKENIQVKIANTTGSSVCTRLSGSGDDVEKWKMMVWLQKQREVGIWIECCNKNCKKWRFVGSIHDPVNVPETWFCSMNPNEYYSSCEDPVEDSYYFNKEDLIQNKYNAGSLVWARVNGYPWWPGMVDDCPETLNYYQLTGKSNIPVRYHVTFFDDKPLRTWLTPRCIEPLKQYDAIQPGNRKRLIYHGINYTEQVKKYFKEAKSAIPLTITERLQKYSFFTRCENKMLIKTKTTDSDIKPKKKRPSRITAKKSSKKNKAKSKVSKIPPKKEEVSILPESALEQNIISEIQRTSTSVDFFEESPEIRIEVSQDSGVLVKNNISQKSRPSTPFDKEAVLAIMKDFVDNKLFQEHMKLTGRNLIEDTNLRQERCEKKELQKESLYFDIEYEVETECSSQASSSAYASQNSEYVFGSQPETPKKILPVIVLKRNSHIEDLLQKALAKKAKLH